MAAELLWRLYRSGFYRCRFRGIGRESRDSQLLALVIPTHNKDVKVGVYGFLVAPSWSSIHQDCMRYRVRQ